MLEGRGAFNVRGKGMASLLKRMRFEENYLGAQSRLRHYLQQKDGRNPQQ